MKIPASVSVLILAVIVFCFSLVHGFSLAVRKPLWNDEIYSQVASVEGMTFSAIWKGGIKEGNNAPLFYSIQKVICVAFKYYGGDLWHKDDFAGRIILRIMPVVFMSLSLALLLWYVSRLYSLIAGALILLMMLSTFLVWAYWAEARPYAMIFFGTVLQSVVLLNSFRSKDHQKSWKPVAVAHIFLAFTTPLSVIQVSSATMMLWFAGYRKIGMLFWMGAVPMAIAFGYHAVFPDHYVFYFASWGQPMALIRSAIPEGRLQFLLIVPGILWFLARKSKVNIGNDVWLMQGWFWLMMTGYGLFLLDLWIKQKPSVGFEISNRYMMALAPASMMAMIVLCMELVRCPRSWWGRAVAWGFILTIILSGIIKIFRWSGGF